MNQGVAVLRTVVAAAMLVCGLALASQRSAAAFDPHGRPDGQASQQTPAQPVFRSGVGVVRVDVTVLDRRGHPVPDLTAEDFEIRERGVPQSISWMQYVQITGQPRPGDDTSLAIRSPAHAAQEAARDDVRVLVIFLDNFHLRNGPGFDVQLKGMLRGFVRAEMEPTDLFAVTGPLVPVSSLRLTRDKQEILDQIAAFEGMMGGLVTPRTPVEELQFMGDPAAQRGLRAQVTLTALQSLASHLGSLRNARTSVLFVSEGPPLRAEGISTTSELDAVVKAANTSNVTIHTLDPRSLGGRRWPSDVNTALAADTGGREIGDTNNSSRGLASVIADSSAYYLLGYTPQGDIADGKFHGIDVRVRRKDVRVIARKGYWAPTAAEMSRAAAGPTTPTDIAEAVGSLAVAGRSPAAAPPAPAGGVGEPVLVQAPNAAAQRAIAAGETVTPTADRRFRRTDRVMVRLPLAAEARGASVRAELVNTRGQTLVDLPVTLDAAGQPLVELPIANLARAEYVLRLTATLEGGPVSRLVAFAVVP